ncbi:hypothetical protein D3C87_2063490 [compost metagenome]
MDFPPIYITDEELDVICKPLTQPFARVKFLEGLGMRCARRPNGGVLLARSEFERVLGGSRAGVPPGSGRDDGFNWSKPI